MQYNGNISFLMPTMLARSRMDPNRNEEEGAQGRPLAQWAYHEFHGKIAQVQYLLIRCNKKCKHLRVAISNKASSGEESNGWTRTSPGFSRTDTRGRQN